MPKHEKNTKKESLIFDTKLIPAKKKADNGCVSSSETMFNAFFYGKGAIENYKMAKKYLDIAEKSAPKPYGYSNVLRSKFILELYDGCGELAKKELINYTKYALGSFLPYWEWKLELYDFMEAFLAVNEYEKADNIIFINEYKKSNYDELEAKKKPFSYHVKKSSDGCIISTQYMYKIFYYGRSIKQNYAMATHYLEKIIFYGCVFYDDELSQKDINIFLDAFNKRFLLAEKKGDDYEIQKIFIHYMVFLMDKKIPLKKWNYEIFRKLNMLKAKIPDYVPKEEKTE